MMKNNKGYILLEIMVSLAIIALVFVSLFRMQSGTIDLASAGQFKNMAPLLAQIKLTEIQADPDAADADSGQFDDGAQGYLWQYSITNGEESPALDFIDPDRRARLKKIDLVITRQIDQKIYRLTTWRVTNE